MIIGPDGYLGCPKCSEIMRVRTLISGHSGGATRWSDGKTAYPMLWAPHPPAICPHCRRFFLRHEGHSFGWKGMMDEEIPNAEAITAKLVPAEEQDYYDALQQGFAGGNPLNERILRISAWWLRNDTWRWPTISLREQRRRKRFPGRLIPTTLTDIQRENLLALAKLLDDQVPQDRLLRFELLRELGEFKTALDYPVAPVSTTQSADAREEAAGHPAGMTGFDTSCSHVGPAGLRDLPQKCMSSPHGQTHNPANRLRSPPLRALTFS